MERKTRDMMIAGGAVVAVFMIIALSAEPPKPVAKPAMVLLLPTEFREIQKSSVSATYVMIADPRTPVTDFERIAKDKCAGLQFCSVHTWTDKTNAPTVFPMLDREVNASVYSYSVNRHMNHERSLWNCKVYPTVSKDRCAAQIEEEQG